MMELLLEHSACRPVPISPWSRVAAGWGDPGISSQMEPVDEHTIRFSMFWVPVIISFPFPEQCYPMELGDAGN